MRETCSDYDYQSSAAGYAREYTYTISGHTVVLDGSPTIRIATMVVHDRDLSRPVAVEGNAELG